ncbi:glycosyl hydrolase family 28 protein [Puia sp. P3]|uniref:glycosyl hydrolase family 28 protein n=1 Tax=Puia sp. P3 TaxID=3423952 RepID=UPI003D673623
MVVSWMGMGMLALDSEGPAYGGRVEAEGCFGGVVTEDGRTRFPSEKSMKGYRTKEAGVLKPGMTPDQFGEIRDFLRPNLLVLTNCKKVLLEGTSFQNSPAWCLHVLLCEHLTLHDVHVRNPWNAANGDGIDVESCRNVLLDGNTFDAGTTASV